MNVFRDISDGLTGCAMPGVEELKLAVARNCKGQEGKTTF
jgi:hypothetical protein